MVLRLDYAGGTDRLHPTSATVRLHIQFDTFRLHLHSDTVRLQHKRSFQWTMTSASRHCAN